MEAVLKDQALTAISNMISLIKHGWTQHVMARDTKGEEINWFSKEAQSFCLVGAYANTLGSTGIPRSVQNAVATVITKVLIRKATEDSWNDWNDAPERTQQDVIVLLKEAKALIEKEDS